MVDDGTKANDDENILEVSIIEHFWVIISIITGAFMGFAIGYLFIYQITNVFQNITTVEEMILSKSKAPSPFKRKTAK